MDGPFAGKLQLLFLVAIALALLPPRRSVVRAAANEAVSGLLEEGHDAQASAQPVASQASAQPVDSQASAQPVDSVPSAKPVVGPVDVPGVPAPAEWSYRDLDKWRTKGMCDHKDDQSPINVVNAVSMTEQTTSEGLEALKLSAATSTASADLETNLYTWEVHWPSTASEEAKITWSDKHYFLRRFHFHSPSENTVNGQYYDMEAQHVHVAEDGQVLVVALLLKVGKPNSFLKKFWSLFPRTVGQKSRNVKVDNPYEFFMPEDNSYYSWTGSLTTPPCTNNVVWVLLQQPVTISEEQLHAYRSALQAIPGNQLAVHKGVTYPGVSPTWDSSIGVNNRPVQPLAHRTVQTYIDTGFSIGNMDLKSMFFPWGSIVLGVLVAACFLCLCIWICKRCQCPKRSSKNSGSATMRGLKTVRAEDSRSEEQPLVAQQENFALSGPRGAFFLEVPGGSGTVKDYVTKPPAGSIDPSFFNYGMASPSVPQVDVPCSACGAPGRVGQFCGQCGKPIVPGEGAAYGQYGQAPYGVGGYATPSNPSYATPPGYAGMTPQYSSHYSNGPHGGSMYHSASGYGQQSMY